jgi:hypothetical protein
VGCTRLLSELAFCPARSVTCIYQRHPRSLIVKRKGKIRGETRRTSRRSSSAGSSKTPTVLGPGKPGDTGLVFTTRYGTLPRTGAQVGSVQAPGSSLSIRLPALVV